MKTPVHYDVDRICADIDAAIIAGGLPANPQPHMEAKLRLRQLNVEFARAFFSEKNLGIEETIIMRAVANIVAEFLTVVSSPLPNEQKAAPYMLFEQYLRAFSQQILAGQAFKMGGVTAEPRVGGTA